MFVQQKCVLKNADTITTDVILFKPIFIYVSSNWQRKNDKRSYVQSIDNVIRYIKFCHAHMYTYTYKYTNTYTPHSTIVKHRCGYHLIASSMNYNYIATYLSPVLKYLGFAFAEACF